MIFADMLNKIMEETNTTDKELAHHTGFTKANINRWRRPTYPPKITTASKLLRAMGYKLVIRKIKDGDTNE